MDTTETGYTRQGAIGHGVAAAGDGHVRINVGDTERKISVAAGAALAIYGFLRGSLGGFALVLAGGSLVYRGLSGRCHVYNALGMNRAVPREPGAPGTVEGNLGIKIDESITVNAPPERLFRFWRNLENLPRIMSHVESVQVLDDRRSRWTIRAPGGVRLEWDAEIINERPDEMIAWRTIRNPTVDHAGSVRFVRVPGGGGTRVDVSLQYDPPGGALGHAVASMFGSDAGRQVADDLRNFKRALETGAIAV